MNMWSIKSITQTAGVLLTLGSFLLCPRYSQAGPVDSLLKQVNQERARKKLSALIVDKDLNRLAAERVEDFSRGQKPTVSMETYFKEAGIRQGGYTLLYVEGANTPEIALKSWIRDPKHSTKIYSRSLTHFGAGRSHSGDSWVLLMIKKTGYSPLWKIESVNQFEKEAWKLTNKERQKYGLQPTQWDPELNRVARLKSEDMRVKNYFNHQSPTYGSPFDMLATMGVKHSMAGENLAQGQESAAEVVKGWMNSPEHRANILTPGYTNMGIGYDPYSDNWTQLFTRLPGSTHKVEKADIAQMERELVDLLNQTRRDNGVPSFLVLSETNRAGRDAAQLVGKLSVPPPDKALEEILNTINTRYRLNAKNISMIVKGGLSEPKLVVENWLKSDYRKSILSRQFDQIGVGYDAGSEVWVVLLIQSR